MDARIRRAWRATGALLAGLPHAFAALLYVAVAPLLLLGLVFTGDAIRPIRHLAERERQRLSQRSGRSIPSPYRRVPADGYRDRITAVFTDPATWRDLLWLVIDGSVWAYGSLIAVALWPAVVFNLLIPLLWTVFPPGTFTVIVVPISNWPLALTLPILQAVVYAVIIVVAIPPAARALTSLSTSLLRPALGDEVARLAATRTAALESHGAELQRIERDLHDGVQAHLVTISVRLGLAERAVRAGEGSADTATSLIQDARTGIEDVLAELRTIVRGIFPPILNDRGLAGAVHALAADREIPVTVRIPDDLARPPAPVEAAAYFVVAEALTNVTRHSAATRSEVIVARANGSLLITVADDGIGGADEAAGSGLAGIRRRIAALDGSCSVSSPAGGGTRIEVALPCES